MTITNNAPVTVRNPEAPEMPFPASTDSNYELVIERYVHLNPSIPTNVFSFTPPADNGISPMSTAADISIPMECATWRDLSMPVNHTASIVILPIPAEVSPTGNAQTWIAVFGSIEGHWMLWDASLYFLFGGDISAIPALSFASAYWPTFRDNVLHPSFAPEGDRQYWSRPDNFDQLGYVARLTPPLQTPVPSFWRQSSDFGDIRTGFMFATGEVALHNPFGEAPPVSPELASSEINANYRIIARRLVNTTEVPDIPTDTEVDATIRQQRSRIVALEAVIDKAKEACRTTTLEHDGCEPGKREFLADTGLFTANEIDGFFERDYEVSWSVTVTGTYTTNASTRDLAREDVEELTQSEIDDMIRRAVGNENFDIEITDVEEA